MMWNRNLDRKIEEAGWLFNKKDDRGVTYTKASITCSYVKYKVIEIFHNQFIAYSVIQGSSLSLKEPARLTYKELKLFTKKFKQIKKEYGWK